MRDRPIYLLKSRGTSNQRYHFAIFIPVSDSITADLSDNQFDCIGTKIHVVGAPMHGFAHEIKWSYNPSVSGTLRGYAVLGHVSQESIEDTAIDESDPKAARQGPFIDIAFQVTPPRASANFLAHVNDTTNRRCQEWTMDYIRALVRSGVLPADAEAVAQAERDPPSHGIGLRPIGQG